MANLHFLKGSIAGKNQQARINRAFSGYPKWKEANMAARCLPYEMSPSWGDINMPS